MKMYLSLYIHITILFICILFVDLLICLSNLFVYFLSDQLILDILYAGKYIPHFFDLEKKKSSLTVAIKLRRTTIVAALIDYCIEKANSNNHPGWLQTVV